MIILPVGDVNPREKTPVVNWLLMAANVGVFLMYAFGPKYEQIVMSYGMIPSHMSLKTLITSQFLHANVLHLLGNMVFLWICGDNVEDRLGHIRYLLFYLAGGAFAGLAHAWMVGPGAAAIPTIGASGSIACILGAYVVLFPGSRIRFFYFSWLIFFPYMGTFTLPSFLAIGFWFVEQVLLGVVTKGGPTGVAYMAHVGGFVFGVVIVGILSVTGLVRRGMRFAYE
jgi:membrane associated rhomboid family serine protease